METKNLTNCTATQLGNAVKKDLKKVSPFYFINQLNALARKNEYLEGINLSQLASRCKDYQTKHNLVDNNGKSFRYSFVGDMLMKDFKGRFVVVVSIPDYKVNQIDAKSIVRFAEDTGIVVDAANGWEIGLDNNGFYYFKPVQLSLTGFVGAFVEALKADEFIEKQAEKASKQEQKKLAKQAAAAARKLEREKEKEQRKLEKDTNKLISNLISERLKGNISEEEYTANLLALGAKVVANVA